MLNAIPFSAEIEIEAASAEAKGPRRFDVLAYNGGPLVVEKYDEPVVVDLSEMSQRKSIVANLDHDRTKRVGQVTEVINDGKTLRLRGIASAVTPARDEVINSFDAGFSWQASIEAMPKKLLRVNAGKTVSVNGQTFAGPLYVAKPSELKGFAFVSHGADDDTTVTIAATAAEHLGETMKPEIRAWAESMGIDVDNLSPEKVKVVEANFAGYQPAKMAKSKEEESLEDILAREKANRERVSEITQITAEAIRNNPNAMETIEGMARLAIDGNWDKERFELELLRATRPQSHTVFRHRSEASGGLNNRVIEAAICQAGLLKDYEKNYDDQTLQTAHDKFKNGIGLKQLFLLAASANGYHASYANDVTLEVQRAAFGMKGPQQINAQGWSTIEISSILSNTANKFLREGWNSVDMTPLRIASVRSVRDFKQITTVSLTGALQFEKLGAAGEIKHGTLGEVVYTNKADTYASMLAITRQDIINDDLGALTAVPRRLGRGAGLKLNDIFWTAFLYGETSGFFSASHTNPTGNSNLNTGAADVTVAGLDATNTLFVNQIDPDGKPLGVMPKIMLVPTAQHAAALRLMNSELLIDGTSTAMGGNANVWRGRFRVETSPYMHNTAYTGYSATAWYLLADPNELPAIEIVALNGRVEPTVDTADADFNTLGVQMRGYSDVGVALQEYRAAVKADGGSS